MIELILLLSLTPAATQNAATAQFKPCVWPNTCATEGLQTAKSDFEICLAPRKCGKAVAQPEPKVAQFKPCVWPNTCKAEQPQAPVVAQFKPCVWPNTCGAAVEEKI
jgi:hypothetical protein